MIDVILCASIETFETLCFNFSKEGSHVIIYIYMDPV